jgi:phytoene desaturase
MQKPSSKVIVIGAGVAGIAVAIRLALKGHQVQVFEASAAPGGKLSELKSNGFRFDAGPSLFTMPQYVDELFKLAGEDPRAFFNYEKLETVCKYFYEDGTRISASSDRNKFAVEIEKNTIDTAVSVNKFLDRSKRIYDITNPVFLERSLHKFRSYFNLTTLRSLFRFPQIDPFRTMNQANTANFQDSKTIRLFNRYATYNGSDPYQAPATLNVIPHFEQHFGAYFPKGGMYSIVKALAALAAGCGVKFHFNTYVHSIELEENIVRGVKSGQDFHPADIVVSNMDVWYTYKKLLSGIPIPEKIIRQERSSSALIFYWGISKSFKELDLHNIFFSEDYKREFNHIWERKDIYSDPTVYLNISAKFLPDDAPEGCENWFAMINVPSNSDQNWDALIENARKNILEKLSRILGEDVGKLIVSEDILDPRSIDLKTYSYQGSLYGSSSNSQFSAFLRHANFSSNIKNLYFAGGSVHPGGGIPLSLLSAKIVDDLIA